MSRFVAVDLTGLTPPDVVETLVYEDILAELKADCVARMEAAGVDYNVQMLESDPVVKVLEVAAYREMLLRARVNDAARAVMLAFAQKMDLEHLGVYYGVKRQIVTPATDTTPAVYETDARLRSRVQLAPEALSTAGPEGAYEFHTMSLDTSIKSVRVYSPVPGEVHVLPLTNVGNGTPSASLLSRIRVRLAEEDIRPLTDMVYVRAPAVQEFTVSVNLSIADGPDPLVVKAAALASINAYLESRHKVGTPVMVSGLIAASMVPGVEDVELVSPAADVEPPEDAVAYATMKTVTVV
jgi:phage-related baseplate assembly protein